MANFRDSGKFRKSGSEREKKSSGKKDLNFASGTWEVPLAKSTQILAVKLEKWQWQIMFFFQSKKYMLAVAVKKKKRP